MIAMARYQLIGRKKVPKSKSLPVQYLIHHICGLPIEILLQIFDFLERRDLLRLSLTCQRFRIIINKSYVYRHISLTEDRMTKFSQHHLRSGIMSPLSKKSRLSVPLSNINYIQEITLINPPILNSSNRSIKIAGSYGVTSNLKGGSQSSFQDYTAALRLLLEDAYGIKKISISEVSPYFEFHKDVVPSLILRNFWKRSSPSRTLQFLQLKPQSGWSTILKWSHISLFFSYFDQLRELDLHNFIIDDLKLTSTPVPDISIEKLTLHSCTYADSARKHNKSKKSTPMFSDVHTLQLMNIAHGTDLSMIDFIKQNGKLHTLILDISSPLFYQQVEGKNQFQFDKFNPFFQLLCARTGGYSILKHLQLVEFDLFQYISFKELSDVDSWVEAPTDTFECFLSHLGNFENLTIVLKDSPLLTIDLTINVYSLNSKEWHQLLEPVISTNPKCNLTIKDIYMRELFRLEPEI